MHSRKPLVRIVLRVGFATICVLAGLLPTASGAGDTGQPEEQEDSVVIVPIPKATPSWSLAFRPRNRQGILDSQYFYLAMPTVGAGLRYEFEDETRESNGEKFTEQYHRFSERLGFRSTGWVYHPTLLTFRASLEPELSQVYEEDAQGNSASTNLFTPDYLLSFTILDPKPYTLNLHAERRELPSWSAFRGGFETRIHDFGGDVQLDLSKMFRLSNFYQASFGYNRIDSSVDGFYIQDEISDNFFLHASQQADKLKIDFTSVYSDSVRTVDETTTLTKTLEALLTNKYLFRQTNRIALDGVWSYRRQELNTLEVQSFRLNEHLNWRHRRNLTSFYKFIYAYSDTNGRDSSNSVNLEARLEHLLFENLTTTAGAESLFVDHSGGQEAAVDPFLNLFYNRTIPFGSLSLSGKWDYRLTSRNLDDSQTLVSVRNEAHALQFTQDVFLANYDVEPGSIIVTNRAGTIQYIQGIDYQVELIGDYTSIRNLSLGDIGNGQDVLVHYSYRQDSEYDDGVFSQGYTLGYTLFGNTTLQLSHARSDQYIISGTPPSVLQDSMVTGASIAHRIGRWSESRLEWRDFDRASDLTYQRWQARQRFSIRPMRVLDLSLAGYYGETTYNDQRDDGTARNDSDFYGGTLTARWRIAPRLSFNMEGFSNITDSSVEKNINIGVRSGLIYTYRIWSARLSYELSEQSIDNEIQDSSRIRNYVRFDLVRLYW